MAVHNLTPEQQADIKTALLVNYELIIRDMAGTVLSQVATREVHPSYGMTKATIRTSLAKMEGAIGAYMVLAGQSTHTSVSILATFLDDATAERVTAARGRVTSL